MRWSPSGTWAPYRKFAFREKLLEVLLPRVLELECVLYFWTEVFFVTLEKGTWP